MRKRNPDASPSKPSTSAAAAAAADHSSDSDSVAEDAAAVHGAAGDRDGAAGDDDEPPAASEDPAALGLHEAEVLPSAEPISAFPAAKRPTGRIRPSSRCSRPSDPLLPAMSRPWHCRC